MTERADLAKTDLEHETATYDTYLEMFYSDTERSISKRQLLDETRKLSEKLEVNEEILENLEEAREYLEGVNSYRKLNASESVESLTSRVDELVESYQKAFYNAMETASRPEKDSSIPGPITMKSMNNIEDRFNAEEDLPELINAITD